MRRRHARPRPWVPGNGRALAGIAAALACAAGCGGSPGPVPGAMPYLDPGLVEAGDYRLHYALTPSRDLPAAVAGSYGIEQGRDLAVLTVAIAPRGAHAGASLAGMRVEAEAVSLTGQRQALALARHDEAGRATWIATVAVRHRVPVTIEIRANAEGGPPLRARLTREFRLE